MLFKLFQANRHTPYIPDLEADALWSQPYVFLWTQSHEMNKSVQSFHNLPKRAMRKWGEANLTITIIYKTLISI